MSSSPPPPVSPRKSRGKGLFNSIRKTIRGSKEETPSSSPSLVSPRQWKPFIEIPLESKGHIISTELNKNVSFSDVHFRLNSLDFQCYSKEHSKPCMSFKVSHYTVQNGVDLDPVISVLKRNNGSISPFLTIIIAYPDQQTRVDWENGIKNLLIRNESVIKLQKWWRNRKMRKSFYQYALFVVSKHKQLGLVEEKSDNYYEFSNRNAAAITIQSAWRSYLVRRKTKIVIKNRFEQLKEDRKVNKEVEEVDFQMVKDEDSSKFIVFSKKSKGTLGKSKGSGYVTSARLEKLIDILLREFKGDSAFETIFLNTIPCFSNPYELIQLIRMFMKSGGSETLSRAAEFLVKWATIFPLDFTSEGMDEKVSEILVMVKIGLGKEKADLITRATAFSSRTRPQPSLSFEADGVPLVIHKVEEPKKMLDLDELEMARQLTLISFSIFCNIQMREFNNLAWEKKGKERKAPNILLFIDRSNKLTTWVCESILDAPSIEESAQVIETFIRVSEHCKNLNNFSDFMAIMTGLMHSSISRLRRRWDKISSASSKVFTSLEEYVCMEKNYSALRAATKKATPPIVPFLGVWMQDLVFIDENPTKLKDDHINFDKMEMISDVIERIKYCSKSKYHLMPSPSIQKLLYPENVLNSKSLFDKSLELEPRNTPVLNTSAPLVVISLPEQARRRSNSVATLPIGQSDAFPNWSKSGKY
eukprot:TRINITY_DN7676_c0_g2_i1.p1 TRINITY_DN7676_c0_g2~~TRINITY_DN7676_c0_g2_i1.p1  ORF type:complete len:700 (-),score=223.87 TRINITY_DN7676_c0_g2_i1:205-2304(-)